MTKLLNIEATQTFLHNFIEENEASLAFISTLEGGIICATELNKARMVAEALSSFWQTLLSPQWNRICFEWESSYIVLINTGNWVFAIQENDPNPTTIGLLKMKAKICADHIKAQIE